MIIRRVPRETPTLPDTCLRVLRSLNQMTPLRIPALRGFDFPNRNPYSRTSMKLRALIPLAALTLSATAENWPQYRGPNGDGSTLRIGTGGADNYTDKAASLAGAGSSNVSLNGRGFTIGSTSGSTTFAGNITGSGTLSKDGGSTQTLSGANTYTGGTTINAGTLNATNATGSATGTGALSVEAPATLAGTGHIVLGLGANATIAGRLSIGDTTLGTPVASTFQLATSGAGSTSFGAGSTLAFDLFTGAGSGNNAAISTAADILRLGGNVTFDAAGVLQISNPSAMTGFAAGDLWEIFDWTSIGSITGSLSVGNMVLPTLGAGLAWDTSDLFTTTGAFAGTIDVMKITGVPEPTTFSVGLLCLGAGMARRRRSARVA